MRNSNEIKFFQKELLKWFVLNKRNFPWRRNDITEYELIFTEILLQRTKAETVAKYYYTFFSKYPTWDEIVSAKLTDLEEILQPLGLYRHRSKRFMKIIKYYIENAGKLPKDENTLKSSALSTLYLSAAYKVVILKKKDAFLDVNMSRVLRRFFYPLKIKDVRNDLIIQDLARKVVDSSKCMELNWAILDFAALVCRTNKPRCNECSLFSKCSYIINK